MPRPDAAAGSWSEGIKSHFIRLDRVRRRQPLQAGSNVGHLSQRQLLLLVSTSHGAHHQPGVDAETDGDADAFVWHQTRIEGGIASSMPSPARTARCATSSLAWG